MIDKLTNARKRVLLGVSVVGWLLVITVGSYGRLMAASYDNDPIPPDCSVSTVPVDMPFSMDYFIEESDWFSDAQRTTIKAAYNAGYPTIAYRYTQDVSGTPTPRFGAIIYNYSGTSSATDGLWISGTSTTVGSNTGHIAGHVRLYTTMDGGTVNTPPSFPDPFYSWTTPVTSSGHNVPLGITSLDDTRPIDCIFGVQNVYGGSTFYSLLSEHDAAAPDPETSFWETVTNGFGTIIDFITGLPAFLIDMIVPDGATMSTITGDLSTFFDDKFGLLLWPFEFIVDIFGIFTVDEFANSFTSWCPTATATTTTAGWEFGDLFGQNVKINPCAFQLAAPNIFTFATLMARAMLVIAVAWYLITKYRMVVSR